MRRFTTKGFVLSPAVDVVQECQSLLPMMPYCVFMPQAYLLGYRMREGEDEGEGEEGTALQEG